MSRLVPWLQRRDAAQAAELNDALQSTSMPMMGGRQREGCVTWDQVVKHSTQSFMLADDAGAAGDVSKPNGAAVVDALAQDASKHRQTGWWEVRTREHALRRRLPRHPDHHDDDDEEGGDEAPPRVGRSASDDIVLAGSRDTQ
mmetsp:Transcript_2405/g.4907  ORF Transcript_2405/g.4907 Transcript_2405/m.4907 type:complete len:143 (+) Transcript_2405:113-541(+)